MKYQEVYKMVKKAYDYQAIPNDPYENGRATAETTPITEDEKTRLLGQRGMTRALRQDALKQMQKSRTNYNPYMQVANSMADWALNRLRGSQTGAAGSVGAAAGIGRGIGAVGVTGMSAGKGAKDSGISRPDFKNMDWTKIFKNKPVDEGYDITTHQKTPYILPRAGGYRPPMPGRDIGESLLDYYKRVPGAANLF